MNGIHDVGGMDNMGPLVVEKNEPLFHEDWEREVFSRAIALIGGRYFNLDEVRRIVEWMPPADYLNATYYETWLFGIITLLQEKGYASQKEMESGQVDPGSEQSSAPPSLPTDMALYVMNNCIPANLDLDISPGFQAGDKIRTKNINPLHHTRLPRYARDKRGTIVRDHGVFSFPDVMAHGGPDKPQHVYSVCFNARELWGEEASEYDSVYIDLCEDYMVRETGV